MDENGEILLLHASKNKARPLVLPWALYTLSTVTMSSAKYDELGIFQPNFR